MIYNQLEDRFKNQIDLIKNHIKTLNLEKEILHQFYEYTLHDLGHFSQVASNASNIIKGEDLSQEELFCLLAACYCHDLGMAHTKAQQKFNINKINEIRKLHATLSRIYIFDDMRSCIPEEVYREAIGKISEGHGRWDWESNYFDDISGRNGIIRIRYLVCVLSLADLLDLRNDRKNPNDFNSIKNLLDGSIKSNISIIHWLKHYYSVLPIIKKNKKTIEITLKANVGTKELGSKNFHRRAPLIQELIQGEVLKVINHPTFKKVSSRYFEIKLKEADTYWPCFVQLTESNKFEFPEQLVHDVLKSGFLYPKSKSLNSYDEYKAISPNAFYSNQDLQISFSERPVTIIPTRVELMKSEIKEGIFEDNWDIVLWSTDEYIKDVNTKFIKKALDDIIARTYSIIETSKLIKNGSLKKVYIEASELTLATATATENVVKQAYKFNDPDSDNKELWGGKIELLTPFQKELYARLWKSVQDKLGIKIKYQQFRDFITPEYAYNCSIIPIYRIAKTLHDFNYDLKSEQIQNDLNEKLRIMQPISSFNSKLMGVIHESNYSYHDFDEKYLDNLRLLEKTSNTNYWTFTANTINTLKDENARNIILKNANHIIGFIFAKIKEGEICYIRKMTIHPFFRRKGLAQSLIKKLIHSESQSPEFQLHVRKSNSSAIKLYNKIGFNLIEEIKDHFHRTGKTKEEKDALYMNFKK